MTIRNSEHVHRPAYSEPVIAGRPAKCVTCGKRIVYVPPDEHRASYWRGLTGRPAGQSK